jgi:RHS repeat-associated protein
MNHLIKKLQTTNYTILVFFPALISLVVPNSLIYASPNIEMVDDSVSIKDNDVKVVEFVPEVDEGHVGNVDTDETGSSVDSAGENINESVELDDVEPPIDFVEDPEVVDHQRIKFNPSKFAQVNESSGTFDFELPLDIPPGRNGLQPNLALRYSSRGDSEGSIVGYGWSLTIPYIQRVNRRGINSMYNDSYFTSSISGELATSTTDTTLHFPKVENGEFVTYKFVNNTWTAKDKRGNTYIYGLNDNYRQTDPADNTRVFKWMLSEVRDVNDNVIRYEYYQDGSGQIYPDKIYYTGHDSQDGIFEVDFNLTSNLDYATSSVSGFVTETKYRVNEIIAKVNGQWVKKYILSYVTPAIRIRSLLHSVTETGRDESGTEISFQPYVFEYQDSDIPGWVEDVSGWVLPEPIIEYGNGVKSAGSFFIELNGDGLPDIIRSRTSTTQSPNDISRAYINTGNNWSFSQDWTNALNIVAPSGDRFITNIDTDMGYRIVDVNGDGRDDILRNKPLVSPSKAYINNGEGWVDDSAWYPPVPLVKSNGQDNGVRILDLSGDGLPDISLSNNINSNVTYTNTGSGWNQNTSTWIAPSYYIDTSSYDMGLIPMDLNGDGLTDWVRGWGSTSSGTVRQKYLNDGSANWLGANLLPGINADEVFIQNRKDLGYRIADVNGDGLTDIIKFLHENGGNDDKRGYINTGIKWTDVSTDWNMPLPFMEMAPWSDTGNRLIDYNGDGMVDVIGRDQFNVDTIAYKNQSKKVDLLTQITYPMGGSTSVEYKAIQQFRDNSGNLLNQVPFSIFVVSKISKDDAINNSAESAYVYQDGYFSPTPVLDRKFAGFGLVTKTNPDGSKVKTYFHQASSTLSSLGEYDDHISKAGKPFRTEITDSSGNPYSISINKWEKQALGNDAYYVKLVQTMELSYDGNSSHRDRAESYTYDPVGNITQKIDWGEVVGSGDGTFSDTGSDKLTTNISIASSTTSYLFAPYDVVTLDQSSNKLAQTRTYYDNQSLGSLLIGNPTKIEQWKTGSNYADVEKTWNSFGLITQEKDPRDKTTTYAYDQYNMYPASTTNAVGHVVSAEYNYSNGKPKKVIDANGFIFETKFDGLNRVKELKQPDLVTPTTQVIKSTFEYVDSGSLPRVFHKRDYLNSATTTDIYVYRDGFDRTVQERIESEGTNQFSVKDTLYNSTDDVWKHSLPYFSTGASSTPPTGTSALYAVYAYDPVHRVASIDNVIGETTNEYDDWKVVTTDPLGKVKRLYKDARGNLIKVEEIEGTNTYTTQYEYDGNNNLKKITDAVGNIRSFTYDGLSRRLTAEDLHATNDSYFGTWSFGFDDTGNLITQTDPKSQTVNYAYDDINRVVSEDYTGATGTEIIYGYDNCSSGVGKLCTVSKSGYALAREYNPLGGVKREVKTIDDNQLATSYVYDRLGNVQNVTHPDGSITQNEYSSAGTLERIFWKESIASDAIVHPIIKDIDYSPLGQKGYVEYGNNASTTNTYNSSELYRLLNKKTSSPGQLQTETHTVRIYSGAGDGQVSNTTSANSSWSTARQATSGTTVCASCAGPASFAGASEASFATNLFGIHRGFFVFDTGVIPSNATITGATLHVYASSTGFTNTDNDGADFVSVVQTSQSSNSTLALEDFDQVGTIEGSSRIDFGSLSLNNHNSFALNTTGLGWIKKAGQTSACGAGTGMTCLGTREGHDLLNSVITQNTGNLVYGAYSEASGTSTDPYLEITYEVTGQPILYQDISYTYDPVGNITSISENANTSAKRNVSYSYDDLHRLTRASSTNIASGNFVETYGYNAVGNITSKSDQGSYQYSGNTGTNYANPHAPTTINSVALTYDSNGNLLSYTGRNNSWNYRNELVSTTGTATTTAVYDHVGERIQYTDTSSATLYPNREYDFETVSDTKTKYIYAGDDLVATIETKPVLESMNGYSSVELEIEGQQSSSMCCQNEIPVSHTIHYVHSDHLAGSNVVTDSSGVLEETMDYYPFGKVRVDESIGSFSEAHKFIGEFYDEESQLSYLNARYHDGARGQFLSQDPSFLDIGKGKAFESKYERTLQQHLTNPQALNSYSYAHNNPITNKDPEGEILPLLAAAWAIAEIGLSVYDGYNAYQTNNDPNASALDKSIATGGFLAGLIGPAGGYGAAAKGWLRFSEGAGHTIQRHIGKTVGELTQRLSNQQNLRMVSSFYDEANAENIIGTAIRENRSSVKNWLKTGGNKLEINYSGKDNIGILVERGNNAVQHVKDATIVLFKNSNGKGYHIKTAFPTKRR